MQVPVITNGLVYNNEVVLDIYCEGIYTTYKMSPTKRDKTKGNIRMTEILGNIYSIK